MLERDDIDAVIIATGDRWHAAASMLAAEAGKDVYSEKPCGITIADCQNIARHVCSEQIASFKPAPNGGVYRISRKQ